MADPIKLNVQTIGGNFDFTPDTLEFDIMSQDVLAGTSMVHYKLYLAVPFDATKYFFRSWVDEGIIIIPTSVVANASSNGQLNVDLFNEILAGFNLSIVP